LQDDKASADSEQARVLEENIKLETSEKKHRIDLSKLESKMNSMKDEMSSMIATHGDLLRRMFRHGSRGFAKTE